MEVSLGINRQTETLVTFSEGRKLVKQRPPSYYCLRRWADHGVRSEGAGRVYLECIRIGPVRYTSIEAFERFLDQLNGKAVPA